jgi:opacity protein-like surface antigen
MKKTLPLLFLITPMAFAQSANGDPELFENAHVADVVSAVEKTPSMTITESATPTVENKPVIKLIPEQPSIKSPEVNASIVNSPLPPLTSPKPIIKQTEITPKAVIIPKESIKKPLTPPPQAQLKTPDLSQPYQPFLAKASSNQYRDIYFGYTELNLPLSPNDPLLTKKIDGGTFGFQYTHLSYPAQEGKVNVGLRIGADVSYGKEKSQVDLLGQDIRLDRHHVLAGVTLAPLVAFHLTDNFMVFGQGGAAFSYINVKATATEWLLPYPKEDESLSDMALGYTYGGGLNYTFADQSTLGLEYQYKDIEHKRENEETFDLNTHTVKLTFGKRF